MTADRINQGFFKRLMIQQDGTVEQVELTEPFAALMAWDGAGGLTAARKGRSKSAGADEGQAELRRDDNMPTSGEGRGVNEDSLVDLLSAYSKHPDLLVDLDHVSRQLEQADDAIGAQSVQSTGRVGRAHSLQDRLIDVDVRKIILSFEGGTPRYKIAEEHRISMSSVARLLRKWRAE